MLPKHHEESRGFRRAHPWRRVFALVGALLLVIVIPSVLVVYFHPGKVAAAWFDNNWGFRERIPITNTSGSTQTNFQVQLTVDTATLITNSKMLSSCNDLRVTSNVGKLLPYWIEPTTCNTSATKIWVKVDSIPTTNGEIYIYYGNPSAPSANYKTTSVFLDDIGGLVGAWNMDEATNSWNGTSGEVKDSSGNSNNGTGTGYNGTTSPVVGQYNNAGSFNGTNNYVVTNSNLGVSGTSPRTISAWIYPTSASGSQVYFATGTNSANAAVDLIFNQNTKDVYIAFLSNDWHTANNVISLNTWSYITIVYDGGIASTSTIHIYVNGIPQTVSFAGGGGGTPNTTSSVAYIGRNFTAANYFSGNIDEVKVYNTALTASQISDTYGTAGSNEAYATPNYANHSLVRQFNANVTVGSAATEETSTAPTLWWKFDDGTGTSAKDASSNANTGTLGGTTVPTWQTEDVCISGKCLFFDGASSKVTGSKVSAVQSIAFWIRPNTIATQGLLNLDGGTHKISTNGSGVITATGFTSPTYYINGVATTTPTLVQNQWNYVEITTGTSFNTTSSFTVGTDGTNFIKGFFDEVKFYNYARTQAQVNADFLIGQTKIGGSSSTSNNQNQFLSQGLVGYWKLDESSWNGTSNEVKDSSGNSNNGTASGDTGTSSGSNSTTTLNDTTKSWPASNGLANDTITITGGTDNGDTRTISSNTTTQVTVSSAWAITPDATSTYRITPSTVAGKFGNAENVDGYKGVITVPDATSLKPTNISVSLWFKSTSSAQTGVLGKYSVGGSAPGYGVRFNFTANKIGFWVGGATWTDSNKSVNDGIWHHFVGTYDGKNATVYIDGVLDKSQAETGNLSGSVNLLLGQVNNVATSFSGTIDEARIYNRALSAQEVSQLYNYAPGPVGWWKMDERTGTSAFDSSGKANTGTWNGTPTNIWTTGKYGSAGNFNGTNNYVANFASNISPVGSRTVCAWIKPSSTARMGILGTRDTIAGNGFSFLINTSAGNLTYSHVTSGSSITVAAGISVGVWQHVCATYDISTTTASLYKNGALLGTQASFTADITNAFNGVIGGENQVVNTPFLGQIDDVRIYNYARTQSQIQQDMQGSPNANTNSGGSTATSQPAAPLGYWRFDDGFGTTANNDGSGGSALNGTLTNMASPATSTSGWQNTGCKSNKCLAFDGTNDYVDVGNSSILNLTTQFTISAWVNVTTLKNYNQIFLKNNNSDYYGYAIDSAGHIITQLKNNNAGLQASTTSATTINAGNWYHVVFTYDASLPSSNIKLYINGTQDSVTGNFTAGAGVNTADGLIGEDQINGRNFNGKIDEVKVFPYALTADQVRNDYNLGSSVNYSTGTVEAANLPSGAGSAPVADWEFEERTGTTVNDTSGQGNTGTWNGTGTKHWATGKVGAAGNFNGVDDYVSTTTNLGTSPAPAVTAEVWFKTTSTAGHPIVGLENFQTGTGSPAYDRTIWVGTDGKVRAEVYDGAAHNLASTNSSYADGNWHYAVLTDNGTVSTLYVDGQFQQQVTGHGYAGYGATSYWRIGSYAAALNHTNAADGYFSGQIDAVRIYNYARSADQIAYDYNRGAPVARWRFDECQGTVANDSSGNGNTGTITIGASGTQTAAGTCNTSGTAWGNGATGKYNASLNFDGTDDHISVASNSNLNFSGGNFAISAWVNPSDLSGFPCILGKGNGSSTDEEYLFCIGGAGGTGGGKKLTLFYKNSWWGAGGNILTTSTWQHVVVVVSGGNTITFYQNGIQTNQVTGVSGTYGPTLTTGLEIAKQGTTVGHYFPGQLDDVRIYNYALTTAQVQLLYNNNSAAAYEPVTGSP